MANREMEGTRETRAGRLEGRWRTRGVEGRGAERRKEDATGKVEPDNFNGRIATERERSSGLIRKKYVSVYRRECLALIVSRKRGRALPLQRKSLRPFLPLHHSARPCALRSQAQPRRLVKVSTRVKHPKESVDSFAFLFATGRNYVAKPRPLYATLLE